MRQRLTSLTRFTTLLLALLAVSFTLCPEAHARRHRVDDIPNGDRFECLNCHATSTGRDFNLLGSSALSALFGPGATRDQEIDWALLFEADHDGDGFTTGEELGDPEGLWMMGDADPSATLITNPGDPDSHPPAECGDGRVTPPLEECEGENLRARTCVRLGYDSGELSCTPECLYDLSLCVGDPTPPPEEDTGAADDTSSVGEDVMSSSDVSSSDATANSDDGGCGCSVRRDANPAAPAAALLGLLIGFIAWRRRR